MDVNLALDLSGVTVGIILIIVITLIVGVGLWRAFKDYW